MLRHSSKAVLIILACVLAAVSQEKARQTKGELIGQFATLTKANQIDIKIELSLADVTNRMSSMIEGDDALSDGQKQELKKFSAELSDRLSQQTQKQLSDSQVLTKVGEEVVHDIYDRAFTEAELLELITFFKTPAGQKAVDFFRNSKGQMEHEFQTRVQSKIQEITQPMIASSMSELARRVKEIKKK